MRGDTGHPARSNRACNKYISDAIARAHTFRIVAPTCWTSHVDPWQAGHVGALRPRRTRSRSAAKTRRTPASSIVCRGVHAVLALGLSTCCALRGNVRSGTTARWPVVRHITDSRLPCEALPEIPRAPGLESCTSEPGRCLATSSSTSTASLEVVPPGSPCKQGCFAGRGALARREASSSRDGAGKQSCTTWTWTRSMRWGAECMAPEGLPGGGPQRRSWARGKASRVHITSPLPPHRRGSRRGASPRRRRSRCTCCPGRCMRGSYCTFSSDRRQSDAASDRNLHGLARVNAVGRGGGAGHTRGTCRYQSSSG